MGLTEYVISQLNFGQTGDYTPDYLIIIPKWLILSWSYGSSTKYHSVKSKKLNVVNEEDLEIESVLESKRAAHSFSIMKILFF
jgi:hypothetical protein